VAGRVRVRAIDDDEGRRLVRIVRRDSGPVVTWRRAQMVLLPAQGMAVAAHAEVTKVRLIGFGQSGVPSRQFSPVMTAGSLMPMRPSCLLQAFPSRELQR
jgi:hypothetical protein